MTDHYSDLEPQPNDIILTFIVAFLLGVFITSVAIFLAKSAYIVIVGIVFLVFLLLVLL